MTKIVYHLLIEKSRLILNFLGIYVFATNQLGGRRLHQIARRAICKGDSASLPWGELCSPMEPPHPTASQIKPNGNFSDFSKANHHRNFLCCKKSVFSFSVSLGRFLLIIDTILCYYNTIKSERRIFMLVILAALSDVVYFIKKFFEDAFAGLLGK